MTEDDAVAGVVLTVQPTKLALVDAAFEDQSVDAVLYAHIHHAE